MMFKPVLAGLTLLALAGCTTTAAERRAIDAQACTGYGFQQGTDAFANCLLTLDVERQTAQRERMAALRDRGPQVIVVREDDD
ncbi:hypothetical protein [Pelagibacterium montanilacus]|uniref:hypothetical protein n=1 Tax=Pelagibacterium montanilacus TaxID=2185280 RepID=UPI000F8E35D5|nr:hypothetical protein [Pelagibacterium montanilacus]